MTREEAEAFVRQCGEDEGPESYEDALELFRAIIGRPATAQDGDAGEIWSHCCADGARKDLSPEEN